MRLKYLQNLFSGGRCFLIKCEQPIFVHFSLQAFWQHFLNHFTFFRPPDSSRQDHKPWNTKKTMLHISPANTLQDFSVFPPLTIVGQLLIPVEKLFLDVVGRHSVSLRPSKQVPEGDEALFSSKQPCAPSPLLQLQHDADHLRGVGRRDAASLR